jgi:crotonobetainyl-CoA:carnitine CoA-transferase CaiB-like acyl-CoA transferase
VVEASRPRALAAMGLTPTDVLAGRTRLWVSITGYGRTPPADRRIAFGDDAAAAGGAVLVDDAGPVFCGDALADPMSGLVAADAALTALADGGRRLLDVAMAAVAATVAPSSGERAVAAPEPCPLMLPRPRGTARALGADTADVLASLT